MKPDDDGDDLDLLAGEYVLGTLPADERREVERRLTAEPALRAAVAAWEARLLPLTGLVVPVEPSPDLWSRIEARLAPASPGVSAETSAATAAGAATPTGAAATTGRATQTAGRAPGGWRGWWNSLALWRSLAAAGIALALALGLRPGLLGLGRPPQYVVVLVSPGAQAPGWVVQVRAPGEALLNAVARAPLPPDRALELWTKADDWPAPVSLGLVRPGEALRLRLDRLPALQPNQLFEITLEPPSGSPTGRPTGPVQYIGRAVAL